MRGLFIIRSEFCRSPIVRGLRNPSKDSVWKALVVCGGSFANSPMIVLGDAHVVNPGGARARSGSRSWPAACLPPKPSTAAAGQVDRRAVVGAVGEAVLRDDRDG